MDWSGIPTNVQDGIRSAFGETLLSLSRVKVEIKSGHLDDRVLVLTRWRMSIVFKKVPVKVENSFNFLEIQNLTPFNVDQLAVETGRGSFNLRFETLQERQQLLNHVNCALSKIFPTSPPFLSQDRSASSPCDHSLGTAKPYSPRSRVCCGGFSETYAALCDYNGVQCREEVQWDVDTIYHSQDSRQFNILDFSHLQSRDLALIVAALGYNQWFRKLTTRDLKLGAEVIEQILHSLSRSLSIEELEMENSGLRADFGQQLAAALLSNGFPALTAVSLPSNPLEDKGITSFSQYLCGCEKGLRLLNLSNTSLTSRGLQPLAQALNNNEIFANTLTHLDLSKNTGLLSGEEASFLYQFLASPNVLVDLNLAGTDSKLDVLFDAISRGCSQLSSLNVSQNTFCHRVSFSGTRLSAPALRALLLGLASNPLLSDLTLDLSGCELRANGARVLEENVSHVRGLSKIDLSDNGLDSDLLTLLPALGLCPSLRTLAIGSNFNVKTKTLEEILQTLVQVFQEEGCIQSLSVANSKLRARGTLLLNALGSNVRLREVDISGNSMGNLGAKMLAKALQVNSTLRTISWDRNNTTTAGFLDVARALESNFTLREMPIPLSDLTHSRRTNPGKTEEALQKIQRALLRNNRTHRFSQDHSFRLQQGMMRSSAEQMMERLCVKVDSDVRILRNCPVDSIQEKLRHAQDMLNDARNSQALFPSFLDLVQRTSQSRSLSPTLEAVSTQVSGTVEDQLQVLLDSMVTLAHELCPLAVGRAEANQKLQEVWDRVPRPGCFVRAAILEQAGASMQRKISELTLLLVTSLTNTLMDEILHELYCCHKTLLQDITQVQTLRVNHSPHIPTSQHFLLGGRQKANNGTEDDLSNSIDTLAVRRHTAHSRSIRPASAYLSVSDQEPDPLTEEETLSARVSTSTNSSLHSHSMDWLGEAPGERRKLELGTQGNPLGHTPLSSPGQNDLLNESGGENGAIPKRDEGLENSSSPEALISTPPAAPVPRKRKSRRRGLFRFIRSRGGHEETEGRDEPTSQASKGSDLTVHGPWGEEENEGAEMGSMHQSSNYMKSSSSSNGSERPEDIRSQEPRSGDNMEGKRQQSIKEKRGDSRAQLAKPPSHSPPPLLQQVKAGWNSRQERKSLQDRGAPEHSMGTERKTEECRCQERELENSAQEVPSGSLLAGRESKHPPPSPPARTGRREQAHNKVIVRPQEEGFRVKSKLPEDEEERVNAPPPVISDNTQERGEGWQRNTVPEPTQTRKPPVKPQRNKPIPTSSGIRTTVALPLERRELEQCVQRSDTGPQREKPPLRKKPLLACRTLSAATDLSGRRMVLDGSRSEGRDVLPSPCQQSPDPDG